MGHAPHQLREDLAITYHVAVGKDQEGLSSMFIKNDLLNQYGITAEQLHEDAMKSSPHVMAPEISSMGALLDEMYQKNILMLTPDEHEMLQEILQESSEMPTFFIVTNTDRIDGAGVIFYPEFMDNMGELLGNDLFILPSSIHEMLILPDDGRVDGEQFYLMEHQKYGNQAQGVILDAYGKMIIEECEQGFDETTKQKIHDYIQQQIPQNPVHQIRQQNQLRLEHYQKYYQNGTYERSRESGTEANYDMVDGLVNNQKNPAKSSDTQMNKKCSQNQRDHVPKKRRSVIKRLREKQIAIAVKSGKPIPKYLDQEMERHK